MCTINQKLSKGKTMFHFIDMVKIIDQWYLKRFHGPKCCKDNNTIEKNRVFFTLSGLI